MAAVSAAFSASPAATKRGAQCVAVVRPKACRGAMVADRALTLNVEDETLARLEALARETRRSSEQLAEEALQRYVEYESWKADKIGDALRRADAGDFASDEEMQAVFDRYRHAAASG